MSKTIQVTLIFFSTIVQCINLNTVSLKDNKPLMKVCSFNKSGQNDQLVMLKPFKCDYHFIWFRSSNLIQWKRRRRIFIHVIKLPRKTDRLRVKRDVDVNNDSLEWYEDSVRVTGPMSVVARFKQQWPVRQWAQYGLYTDDYLTLINSHWLYFAPPDPKIHYALGGLYIVMMVVGCSGNALVLVMYLKLVIIYNYIYFLKR